MTVGRCEGAAGAAPRAPVRCAAGLFVAAAAPCGCLSDAPGHGFAGPMPVRNQHPAQLTVLHLDPQGVTPPPDGSIEARWNNAYTSLFLSGTGGGLTSFRMDGEMWRTALAARLGLGSGLALGVELPFGLGHGGALDGFVIAWHDLFGFPDQGRDRSPRDRFDIEARDAGGRSVFRVEEDSFELLDLPLTASWNFLPITAARPFGMAARAGVELPTGDADAGFGNGEVDVALGLGAELRAGPCSFTARVGHAFAGTPDRADRAGFAFRDVTSFGAGAELWLDESWAVLVQTEHESSTLRDLGIDVVSDDQWLLWTGARARLGPRTTFELAIGEDLSSFVAPDFTLWLGLRHGPFGGGP